MFLTLALFNLQLLWLVQDLKKDEKTQQHSLRCFCWLLEWKKLSWEGRTLVHVLDTHGMLSVCRRHSKVRASTRASNTEVPKQVSSAALYIAVTEVGKQLSEITVKER